MRERHIRFIRIPDHPLARLGFVLAVLALLALGFLVGFMALVIAMGLAIIGRVILGVRRMWFRKKRTAEADRLIDAEYRVIKRERGQDS